MRYAKQMIIVLIALVAAESAFASLNAIQEDIDAEISKGLRHGNEPFLIAGENDSSAVLLMHGFTASPWEVRELGEHLSKENLTVYGPLLAGHGTDVVELKYTKWEEWYETANRSYNLLKDEFDCVYVGGMSTGSLLALKLAREYDVCGIVAIGTPIFFQDWKARFAWIAKYFFPYTEAQLKEEIKPYYYDKRPTAAVAELYEMARLMKDRISEIDEPVIIIHSLEDRTIKPESSSYLMEHIGSEDKKLVWIENSEHVIIKDRNRQYVFGLVSDFIKKLSQE